MYVCISLNTTSFVKLTLLRCTISILPGVFTNIGLQKSFVSCNLTLTFFYLKNPTLNFIRPS